VTTIINLKSLYFKLPATTVIGSPIIGKGDKNSANTPYLSKYILYFLILSLFKISLFSRNSSPS